MLPLSSFQVLYKSLLISQLNCVSFFYPLYNKTFIALQDLAAPLIDPVKKASDKAGFNFLSIIRIFCRC
jgi:hypothetical protein